MITRTSSARWEGTLKEGQGRFAVGSGAFDGAYSFGTRFENTPGTNPEELLGAAHAACFSMAFSAGLTKAGHSPTSIETTATVTLEKGAEGFSITGIELNCIGVVPGVTEADFLRLGEDARKGCPVSRALAVPMTLKAALRAGG